MCRLNSRPHPLSLYLDVESIWEIDEDLKINMHKFILLFNTFVNNKTRLSLYKHRSEDLIIGSLMLLQIPVKYT